MRFWPYVSSLKPFSNFAKNKSNPSRYLPDQEEDRNFLFEKYNKKAIKPSNAELIKNNRSRSAKLRFAIRTNAKFLYPKELFKKFNKYLEIEAINV